MAFASHLKDWRRRRAVSQLRLGLAANVSARHIAYMETGRAHPTRAMVLRLSEALDIPRNDRNALLEAAGFAPAYSSRTLDASEMAAIRAALDWTLARHDPYPGFAFDRHWRLVALNRSASAMLAPIGLGVGDSLLDALLAPDRLRAAVTNWPEVARHMHARLLTESRHVGGDPVLDAAARRLECEIGDPDVRTGVLPAIITTRYRMGDTQVAFFSTIAQFGSAEDIALADMKIELLFPADEATRRILAANGP